MPSSGPPLTEIVATTSQEEERKTHIEVCVRIRPLQIGKESSTSFLSSSNNNKPKTHHRGGSGGPRFSKLTTPPRANRTTQASSLLGQARNQNSLLSTPDRRSNNSNNNTTNNNKQSPQVDSQGGGAGEPQSYAWNVSGDATVQQNPNLENLPGRTTAYTLDHVYGPDASTQQLFDQSVLNLVNASMDGYHASILAYGQTSTYSSIFSARCLH